MRRNALLTQRWPYVNSLLLLLFCTAAPSAFAHEETGVAGGLMSGFLHPFLGPDHLVAMVAVGLWGAQLGNPAIWILPIVFPVVMALGGLLGILGVPIPHIEMGIAFSALLLGAAIAIKFRANLWITGVLVGLFAIFHGHAHGTELPHAANALSYGIGFVIATGLLHLCGILLGTLNHWQQGALAVRACGAVIAVVGVYYVLSASQLL